MTSFPETAGLEPWLITNYSKFFRFLVSTNLETKVMVGEDWSWSWKGTFLSGLRSIDVYPSHSIFCSVVCRRLCGEHNNLNFLKAQSWILADRSNWKYIYKWVKKFKSNSHFAVVWVTETWGCVTVGVNPFQSPPTLLSSWLIAREPNPSSSYSGRTSA